jgi:tetrahydromethanopterin S-methyltransferase subunit A
MGTINNLYWKAREKSGIFWRRSVGRVVDWPPSPGRFVIGNPQSAVAVCTLSSTALIDQLDPKQAAIIGRVYTPNLGVEKMITNVVSNPRLRYLVLCGRESPIFKVGDAVLKLSENGLDSQGKIIGAGGAMAELTNLPTEAVETFRQQIKLINLINETSPKTIDRTIAEYAARRTSAFAAEGLFVRLDRAGSEAIEMQAHRRQWLQLDSSGYFFVQLDREKGELVLEHFTSEKKLTHIIRGRAADILYHTAIAENLLTQLDHAAYLGAELAKAETALYNNLSYEQDKKLRLSAYADSNVL